MQVWLPNPVVISPEPLRENITRATVGPQRIKLPDTHTPLLHPCLCPWFSISCQISFLWQWEWTGIKTLRRTQRGIKQLKNQKQDHFISSYFKNWWDGISRYTTKVHLVASPLPNFLKKPWCRPMITSTITIILSHFFKKQTLYWINTQTSFGLYFIMSTTWMSYTQCCLTAAVSPTAAALCAFTPSRAWRWPRCSYVLHSHESQALLVLSGPGLTAI